jgi:hypothetical protein
METVMKEIKAQFTAAESAVAYNAAVLWKTAPIEVVKARKRKVKMVAVAKSSKGFTKGSNGFAVGYPSKTFI